MSDRLPPFHLNEASDDQKAIIQAIVTGPRGNLNGPFLSWIHSPVLASKAQNLGEFCRYHTGLPLRQSELAIIVTAARWQCQAEWHIHHPIAIAAGLPPEIATSIYAGTIPQFEDADDEMVYEFTTQLYGSLRISDVTYRRNVDRWGNQIVINLVGLLGYYALVAMTLNVFEVRADGQTELPFPEPPTVGKRG